MQNRRKLTKVEKFDNYFSVIRFIIAILIAFMVSLIIISFTSDNAITAIKNLFVGPLTTTRRFSNVLEMAIPLTFSGLAISLMFRANQFNLAVEGGFFLGALGAAIVAINFKGSSLLGILLALLIGGIIGAVICLIPSLINIKLGASELVISLMLNYVALYLGTFIFNLLAKDPSSAYHASYEFRKDISLGRLVPKTRLHAGLIIVIVFVILTYIFMYKTKWGYKLRVVGSNSKFGKYVGFNTASVIISSQLLGGFIGGVGGATEMIGMYTRFQWSTLPGFGFDGVVLNILAKGNPLFIPIAAFAIAYLRVGADYMYKQSNVASEIVSIVEALIIVLVAANAFLSSYRQKKITELAAGTSKGE